MAGMEGQLRLQSRSELARQVEELRAEVARLGRMSHAGPAGIQASLQGILDSTTATIALLDAGGRIVAVNEAWRAFGRENGASPATVDGVGLDYLEVCRRAAGDERAGRILAGIEKVLAGEEPSFRDEYPCSSATVERWFTLDVTRPRGEAGAVVTHADVTAQKQTAQRLAEARSELARQVEARTRELIAANRELRASEQKLRAVLAAHPDLVFRLRRDGRFLGLHAGDPGLLAVPSEETVGANIRDLALPRPFVEQVLGAIGEALDTQRLRSIEYDLEVPRGERHFEARLVPYAEGEVLAIVRDLTESHRARELVAREQEQARRYLDLAGVVMLALDRCGRVTLINRRGCQVLGGAEGEILGRDWFETFIPPRERRRVRRRFTAAMAGRRRLAEHHENPILTLGGVERRISWHNTLLHDPQGAVAGTLSSGEDVTDQRQAEEALRESHDLLQGVVEGTVDSIFVKDLEGRYLVMNAAGAAVLGLPASEIVGRRDVELLPPRSLSAILTADRAVLETGEPEASEDLLEVQGETRIYVTTRAPLRDKAGAIRGVIGVSKEVTAMRRAEAARRAAEEQLAEQRALAVRADRLRSLGQMAAGIAHELNQPLVGVRGLTEHLLLAMGRGWKITPDELAEQLEEIIAQADRMEHIIHHVRVFAREAGKPESRPVDANEVVRSATQLMGVQLASHGVELELALGGGLPPVLANPFSLEEVLLNLLINARDALESERGGESAPGPRIVIRTGRGRLGKGEAVRLQVADNGPGMEAETLEQALTPFFTTKGPEAGTGLGLPVSLAIVESFGGTLSLHSRCGEGTTVTVLLPAARGSGGGAGRREGP